MSVTVLHHEDAFAIPDEAQYALPQARVITNFFEHFGTIGCALDCGSKRTIGTNLEYNQDASPMHTRRDREMARSTRKTHTKDFNRTRWFTGSELASSKSNGCGSCNVLSQILSIVFHNGEKDLPETYNYSVAPSWELKCREASGKAGELTVRLFQYRGVDLRFQHMPESNLLLGRTKSFSRLRQWMSECLSTHKNCANRSIAWNDGMRPARLLDVTFTDKEGQPALRLLETRPGHFYRYVCLSHRWDGGVHLHKTTTQNLAEYMGNIKLSNLTGNFRDAVVITRDLGIQYIWIDSLCIIQKGDNNQDSGREIAKMGFIYQNAQLVIAAVSSPDSDAGCFINNRWPDTCLQINDSNGRTHVIGARTLDQNGQACTQEDVDEHYPLLTRAWVFQERLLSTRLLQCTYGEFSYYCLESSRCECKSSLAPHPSSKVVRNSTYLGKRHLVLRGPHGLQNGDRGRWKNEVLFYWRTLVQRYIQLEITYSDDVLPAIGGCAQVLAHHLQLDYIAGLWKETLSTDILWHVEIQKQACRRPTDSTAPSWSWASIAMGRTITHIGWDNGKSIWTSSQTLLDDVLKEVHCEPQSQANPFGKLKIAYLQLNATLYPWYIRYFCLIARKERVGNYYRLGTEFYAKRGDHSSSCTTHIEELDIRGAFVELRLDEPTRRGDLPAVPFTGCVHIARTLANCALSTVFLLHVLHKEKLPKTLDVFLVLQKIDPTHGKPNCYKRIGLLKLTDYEGDTRAWNDIIHGKIEPRNEELWLF